MELHIVKFNSNNKDFIEKIYLNYLKEGYIIKKAYTKKSYIIFGSIKYYIEMMLSNKGYEKRIEDAMKVEDYLEVSRLKKEYELLQVLNF